ncbi:MAG: manganese efflux pump MntP family protein [Clostridia bacterium]|nr:manganese efflux pump MntP family protein [Clostridia bacterium]
MWWKLILTSILLGVGLAMDACAVSMTNGLNEPRMRHGKAVLIAGTFAFFQALMPMIGWECVSLIAEQFTAFARYIPYIALVLLLIIGGKMLWDGIRHVRVNKRQSAEASDVTADVKAEQSSAKPLTFAALLLQAVATSIDALSTGFSLADIAGNVWWQALISAGIIAVVTFGISVAGVYIGKKFGDKLGSKAEIVGGVILISIGIEIFVTGVFF